jgi:hypothetical protein
LGHGWRIRGTGTRADGKEKEARSDAEFSREITYNTEFGLIFKDKFRISPEGFDYKGSLLTRPPSTRSTRWWMTTDRAETLRDPPSISWGELMQWNERRP